MNNLNNEKICLLIPSLGPGGMERVMSELACYFDKKENIEIHLILYGRSRKIFYSLPSSIHIHKPKFTFDNEKRTFHTLKTLFYLRRQIVSIDPDVILSFGEDWNNLVLLSNLGLNYPIYVSDRAQPGLKRNKFQELLRNLLYRKASGIIIQTDIAKKIYKEKFPSQDVASINNPIRDIQGNNISDVSNKTILSVGRLIETKHFDLLIKMFAEIDLPGWKLIIVGGDSQKQKGTKRLKNLISELNIENKVTLTGTVSNVEDYYKKSSIFAFTSSSEGFPNVIGEAMSAGLPVIAFDCVAGPAELIDDGENGYLVPLFEMDMYKEKLEKLMNNKELRLKMGKNSLAKVNEFSTDKIGEQYFKFIFEEG